MVAVWRSVGIRPCLPPCGAQGSNNYGLSSKCLHPCVKIRNWIPLTFPKVVFTYPFLNVLMKETWGNKGILQSYHVSNHLYVIFITLPFGVHAEAMEMQIWGGLGVAPFFTKRRENTRWWAQIELLRMAHCLLRLRAQSASSRLAPEALLTR